MKRSVVQIILFAALLILVLIIVLNQTGILTGFAAGGGGGSGGGGSGQLRKLSLTMAGSGGSVSTSPAASSSCGTNCYNFPKDSTVTITASVTDPTHWAFHSWSGSGCTSVSVSPSGGTATAIMNQNPNQIKTCVANYRRIFRLQVGSVIVTSTPTMVVLTGTQGLFYSGINCIYNAGAATGVCSDYYWEGSTVSLTSSGTSTPPNDPPLFLGWTADCSSTAGSASVVMNSFKKCEAVFVNENDYNLHMKVVGQGSVKVFQILENHVGTPGILDTCGPPTGGSSQTDCLFNVHPVINDNILPPYIDHRILSFEPMPAPGWFFNSWTGPCDSPNVPLLLDHLVSCTANFILPKVLTANKLPAGTGTGIITSSSPSGSSYTGDVNCGSICTADYNEGTNIGIGIVADTNSDITSVGGSACSGLPISSSGSGAGGTNIVMDADKTCDVQFDLVQRTLSVSKNIQAGGTVTATRSAGSGGSTVSCGTSCSSIPPITQTAPLGSSVSVNAVEAPGYLFDHWTFSYTDKSGQPISAGPTSSIVASTSIPLTSARVNVAAVATFNPDTCSCTSPTLFNTYRINGWNNQFFYDGVSSCEYPSTTFFGDIGGTVTRTSPTSCQWAATPTGGATGIGLTPMVNGYSKRSSVVLGFDEVSCRWSISMVGNNCPFYQFPNGDAYRVNWIGSKTVTGQSPIGDYSKSQGSVVVDILSVSS